MISNSKLSWKEQAAEGWFDKILEAAVWYLSSFSLPLK